MPKKVMYTIGVFSLLLLVAFVFPAKKTTVYLVGDSTMANKEISTYPETGWGMPFTFFFDSTVVVSNHAQNGRSTKTFLTEQRWQAVVDHLSEGDYVFIQFGHNDEVKSKKSYATEAEFKANLVRFITESRNKKALPVLLTPVARRSFDETGQLVDTHEVYSALVREVAKQQNAPLIDLDKRSQELIQRFGVEDSKLLFLHLAPGEHPNYPEGKQDNTHFNELGARQMAQLVLADLKALQVGLAKQIVTPKIKK